MLEDLWKQSHIQKSETRTIRHEAGHAAVAWCLSDGPKAPFKYVEVGTMAEHALGVVPGGVAIDIEWFERLPPVDQGAIDLAGLYYQDELSQPATDDRYTREEWREVLDAVDGADGTDDYARAIGKREPGRTQQEFDEAIRLRIESLRPRAAQLFDIIVLRLTPGTRVTAEELAAHVATSENAPDREMA